MHWKFEVLMKPSAVPLTEGPVWDGEQLLFTHIRASRILRYDPKSGAITEWRTGTNRTNGLAFDAQGRLFGCCSGGRSIVRFDPDGRTVTLADRVEGKKLNTPNDLAIDRKGRIWFTNPWNEGNIDATERQELDNRSVLRADPQPDGSYTVTRVTFDTTQPNGILVSQDQSTLYVAESGYAREVPRELRAYPIREDGSLGTYSTLFTWGADAREIHRGIDGMCLDRDGNIVATAGWELSGAGPMIYVFTPKGRVLETHPVPANRPTNCCFGGPDMT
ncbi:MAG: SMP-30/gluconolactonase/LRE family protein, partial [Betaproteobacteria bacterium]|nr:SMP-30/gluconolactonase/LRE family protein [Betaproteobacteria bacterium]